jgi:hypothetical protein
MSPVYPLVSPCRTRGPVNLGGGHPFKSSSLKPGAGGLSKIGSSVFGEAHFNDGTRRTASTRLPRRGG